jgi:hypothetical protein
MPPPEWVMYYADGTITTNRILVGKDGVVPSM